MDDIRILLHGKMSKESSNTSEGLNVPLNGKKKLLPVDDIGKVVSQFEQYMDERRNSNIIRLVCQVNPVCSNVLFNRITEIVSGEGSNNVTFVNYGVGENRRYGVHKNIQNQDGNSGANLEYWSGNTLYYQWIDNDLFGAPPDITLSEIKESYKGETYYPTGHPTLELGETPSKHPTNAIRDLQLTNQGFIYHCGLDIFNNHLLRSKTFKAVCKLNDNGIEIIDGNGYTAFNTIADLMRDSNGMKVIEKVPFPANVTPKATVVALHLYTSDDAYTYRECVKKKLMGTFEGWYGFKNKSKVKTYETFEIGEDSKQLKIERPIMYMSAGDFVDMYPGKELYSFVPKYNSYRNRIEKNWNYCLTYPSSSYTPSTDGEPFSDIIDPKLKSLKVAFFDENTRNDGGIKQLVIYSVCKHGLVAGDRVNIFKTWTNDGEETSEKIIDSAQVLGVVDDFIFTVFPGDVQISAKWGEVDKLIQSGDYTLDSTKEYLLKGEKKHYRIINDQYANVDDDAQNISYKKVVNDIECEYYVRIFSRLPNFKYASGDTSTEYEIYREREDGRMVDVYSKEEYDFESHVSRLAFAKNVYSDNIGEIVFTDNIDLSNLKDNLGRPLSNIYLTIVKNNKGYKEWYGYDIDKQYWNNNKKDMLCSDLVEYSHCFGKVKCGIEMNEMCDNKQYYPNNIHTLTYNWQYGYKIRNFENPLNTDTGYTTVGNKTASLDDDEVWFDSDINYYGDVSYYDNYNATEHQLQPILHRVNTAQRESTNANSDDFFSSFLYDEIDRDDYDTNGSFVISENKTTGTNDKDEGYYYAPHYKIPINTFGVLKSTMPDFLTIRKISYREDNIYNIVTLQKHFLKKGDKAIIYDRDANKYYYCTTVGNVSDRVFECRIVDEDENKMTVSDWMENHTLKMFKMDNIDAPDYAKVLKDGTCRVIWRDLIKNGTTTDETGVEEYPFTNGAFYVNKRVDLYLRRQDPFNEHGLYSKDDIEGNVVDYTNEDNYVKEEDIVC